MKIICENCKKYKEYYAKNLCNKCYDKKYHAENSEKRNKKTKKWREKNSEYMKEYNKNWRKINSGKLKINNKEYYIENSEKIKKYIKKWAKTNSEKVKEYKEKWIRNNSEKRKAINKKYQQSFKGKLCSRQRSAKRRANGEIKKGIINKIVNENILKYGIITCEKCKKQCEDNFHLDHIQPISKDGSNDYDNLQILCQHCNQSKYVDIIDYRENVENN